MKNKRLSTFAILLSATVGALAQPAAIAPDSRLQIARAAANSAGLHRVGLDFRDLYGVIHAESSWKSRDGMGKNGVVSKGVAQFEPATARAVGLSNPEDPVASVHAAARLLKEAAQWSADRIAKLSLNPQQRAAKLREGVSIYYNLSTRGRSAWDGLNTAALPVETQRHIRNVQVGAVEAEKLHASFGGGKLAPLPAVEFLDHRIAAKAAVKPPTPAKPRAVGTLEWAGKARAGTYVVFSDGRMQQNAQGHVPHGAIQWTKRG